jgi:tetratricopeptide (TPR) repeat protein
MRSIDIIPTHAGFIPPWILLEYKPPPIASFESSVCHFSFVNLTPMSFASSTVHPILAQRLVPQGKARRKALPPSQTQRPPQTENASHRTESWIRRGYALEEGAYYEEALASFERAIMLDAACLDAWQGRGIALAQLGYFEEALASFSRATKLNPADYRAWQNQGKVMMSLGRHREALAQFDRVLLLKMDSYKVWYHRALALDALHKTQAALASLDRALKLRPDCYYAWTAQGMLLNKLSHYADAKASFDCSLRLRSGNFGAWYGKACCYALQGWVSPAVENLQQALKCSPYVVRRMVQADRSFNAIRCTPQFQQAFQEEQSLEPSTNWTR